MAVLLGRGLELGLLGTRRLLLLGARGLLLLGTRGLLFWGTMFSAVGTIVADWGGASAAGLTMGAGCIAVTLLVVALRPALWRLQLPI